MTCIVGCGASRRAYSVAPVPFGLDCELRRVADASPHHRAPPTPTHLADHKGLEVSCWIQKLREFSSTKTIGSGFLIPDGADNGTGEGNNGCRSTLLGRHNLARLNVALPDNNRLVVLVADGNEVPRPVQRKVTRRPTARRSELEKVERAVIVDGEGRQRVRRA